MSKNKPNYLYSIVGVALVLFLLGFFGLILLYTHQLTRLVREKVEVTVELQDSLQENTINALKSTIQRSRFAVPNSVKLITKAEALKMMKAEYGDELLTMDMANPFYALIRFNVKAQYSNRDSLLAIQKVLQQQEGVNYVEYPNVIVDDISQNIANLGWFALGVGLLLIFVAITLIHNTVRLVLYANRFLIKNMQLVGASWGFISRPFLWRSLKNGLWSSIIAISGLVVMIYITEKDLPELKLLQDSTKFMLLFGFLLVLGVFITMLSTYLVVNKYLQMREDDLY